MIDDERDRLTAKRDRTARFYRVVTFLESRGERGATPVEIAQAVGMSKRTAYRDLVAIQEELLIPIWEDGGRYGLDEKGLLPALRLTQAEAMAVFLSARLMARYSDAYDPDLAAAFQKLASGLPEVLAAHVLRTFDLLSQRATDDASERTINQRLTRAWAERRVVEITYRGGTYDPAKGSRTARVRPYLIEPSIATRALYLIGWDETRAAIRTFKLERIEAVALTADRFEAPPEGTIEETFATAWDIIADQPVIDVELRFSPVVAARVRETRWHPSERVEPARRRIADLAGPRVGDARDPELDPRLGRRRHGPRVRPSSRTRSPGSCARPGRTTQEGDGSSPGRLPYPSHAECPCTRPAQSRRARCRPHPQRHLVRPARHRRGID